MRRRPLCSSPVRRAGGIWSTEAAGSAGPSRRWPRGTAAAAALTSSSTSTCPSTARRPRGTGRRSRRRADGTGQSRGMNRLADETSPYLLQHADNPVDWYAWGDDALTRARDEQKPILLSIGYPACHWCHVMEHESFEDETTAALMNEHFVCVKVDREERPDLDSIY